MPVVFIRFEPHLILSRRKGKIFPLYDRRACEGRGTASFICNLGFDRDECSAHPPVAVPPGKELPVSLEKETGYAQYPVWRF